MDFRGNMAGLMMSRTETCIAQLLLQPITTPSKFFFLEYGVMLYNDLSVLYAVSSLGDKQVI